MYPSTRLRRTRQADWSRRLVRQNTLTVNDLIWSVVVSDTADPVEPVMAMLGHELCMNRNFRRCHEVQGLEFLPRDKKLHSSVIAEMRQLLINLRQEGDGNS